MKKMKILYYTYMALLFIFSVAYVILFSFTPMRALIIDEAVSDPMLLLFGLFLLLSVYNPLAYITLFIRGSHKHPLTNTPILITMLVELGAVAMIYFCGYSLINKELNISGYQKVLEMTTESREGRAQYSEIISDGSGMVVTIGDLHTLLNTYRKYKNKKILLDEVDKISSAKRKKNEMKYDIKKTLFNSSLNPIEEENLPFLEDVENGIEKSKREGK